MEEPIECDVQEPFMHIESPVKGVQVLTPMLPRAVQDQDRAAILRELLDRWIASQGIRDFIAWYYTPMALLYTSHLHPYVTVYDCMDELSAFRGAPSGLLQQERLLFERTDVVFAGGRSLYQAKRGQHGNVHLFPSSVDQEHYAASREPQEDPIDQRNIPHPRIGFFGVLDERLDQEMLREIAELEPAWHFVLLGPVVKIDEHELPRSANIHYLGQKQYSELPAYLSHWDVAMLPFAQNESTRFISPTKTLEYLAAGKPVVSTPVRDVVEPYGTLGLARIAANSMEFCEAIRESLRPPDAEWFRRVDNFLRRGSWDKTFQEMWGKVLSARQREGCSQDTERSLHV